MPPFLSEMFGQIKTIWSRLDAGQRFTIGAVLLSTLAGLGAIVWYAGRPDYQAVYTSMSADELHRAQQALLRVNVEFSIEGTTLSVPSTQLGAARGALGSAGMVPGTDGSSGGGTESSLTSMTVDRVTRHYLIEKAKEQRAVANLRQIPAVYHAQVSHSKPERSPYRMLDAQNKPQASVGLKLRPGASFRAVARVAIREVASALGIPESNITVNDLGGLSTFRLDGGGASAEMPGNGEFLAQQTRQTLAKTEKLQSLLNKMFPGKAIGSVEVELDPQWSVIKDRSAAKNPAKKREKKEKDTTRSGVTTGRGDPTTSAALNGTSNGVPGSGKPTTEREVKETEYVEGSLMETTSGKLAPEVRKLSVAVVLDPEAGAEIDEAKLIELIQRTIGWTDGRDDPIALTRASLPEIELPPMVEPSGTMDLVKQYAPIVGQLLGVVLVLMFLRGLLKKNSGPARSAAESSSSGARVSGGQAVEDESTDPDEIARRMRVEIERAISDDPAAVSRLLEGWLQEQGV